MSESWRMKGSEVRKLPVGSAVIIDNPNVINPRPIVRVPQGWWGSDSTDFGPPARGVWFYVLYVPPTDDFDEWPVQVKRKEAA